MVGCLPGMCYEERREYQYLQNQDKKKDLSLWVEHEEIGKIKSFPII